MGLMAARGDRQSNSGDVERGSGGDHGWMDGWGTHPPLLSRPVEVLVGLACSQRYVCMGNPMRQPKAV